MPPSPVDLAPPTAAIASGTSADTNAWYIHQSVRHAAELTAAFDGKATAERRRQVIELLQTLTVLGQARLQEDGLWSNG